jgi:hypothetical protein
VKIDPDAGHAFENPDNKQGYRCTSICAFCRFAPRPQLVFMRSSAVVTEALRLPRNIHETSGREDARNFHLPDGTTLVTMHASSNLGLDLISWD